MEEEKHIKTNLDFINFACLSDLLKIPAENRPTNIFNLMKHGFKHYIKVKKPNIEDPKKTIEAKKTGRLSKTRPSKDFNFYYAYDNNNFLSLYNAETNELINTYTLLTLLDVVFYQYDQDKEDLLTFIKRQIAENIERSLRVFTDTLQRSREEDKKLLKPYLKNFYKLLEEANEQTIDTFIYFYNSFILLETFYLRATIQDKPYTLKEYLDYFKGNFETQLTAQTLAQANLRKQLADFLISLKLSEKEIIEQYSTPAEELIKDIYSNIAIKQDSGNKELARLTALENANKLEGKEYFIFNYFKYNSLIVQGNLLEKNLLEARQLLTDLESGKLENINTLYIAIFTPQEEAELITINGDKLLNATDNIISGLVKMRINAQKVISTTDLELYINKDQLSQEEQEALFTRLRRTDKEDLQDIINYINTKKEYSLKKNELTQAQKELKQAKEQGSNSEDIIYLSQKVEQLRAELKQKGEEIKPLSKNIIYYNGDYYRNKATLYINTLINEEESGKIEITNEDNSISIFKQTKTAVKENDLTYSILFLIIEKVSRTGSNKVFFSIEEIYSFMINKGELLENDTPRNKAYAIERFRENCELLKGIELSYTIFKQKGKQIARKGGGYLVDFTDYKKKVGIEITYSDYLFNNIMRANKGFLILPKETETLTPTAESVIRGLRLLERLHPNAKQIKAGSLAQYLGLGDTNYKGKNKNRVVQPLNEKLQKTEEEKAIKVVSAYPKTLSDTLIIKDLLKSEAYKKALENQKKQKKNKKR